LYPHLFSVTTQDGAGDMPDSDNLETISEMMESEVDDTNNEVNN